MLQTARAGNAPTLAKFFAGKLPLTVSQNHIVLDEARLREGFLATFKDTRRAPFFDEAKIFLEKLPAGDVKAAQLQRLAALRNADDGRDNVAGQDIAGVFALVFPAFDARVTSLTPDLPVIPPASPAGSGAKLLMCSPEEFSYGLTDEVKNRYQWEVFRRTLESNGARLHVIDGTKTLGSYREVFTRDTMLIIGDTAYYPSHTNMSGVRERRTEYEITQMRSELSGLGVKNFKDLPGFFEGGNIVYDKKRDVIFYGEELKKYREEGTLTPEALSAATGKKVITVPLTQARTSIHSGNGNSVIAGPFYHLDTMMAVLPDGAIMLHEAATTPEAVKAIKSEAFRAGDRGKISAYIPLTAKEAESMVTNHIAVNDHVLVAPDCSERLRNILRDHGFEVKTPRSLGFTQNKIGFDVSFLLADGGPHCMTLEVPSVPAPAVSKPLSQSFAMENIDIAEVGLFVSAPPSYRAKPLLNLPTLP